MINSNRLYFLIKNLLNICVLSILSVLTGCGGASVSGASVGTLAVKDAVIDNSFVDSDSLVKDSVDTSAQVLIDEEVEEYKRMLEEINYSEASILNTNIADGTVIERSGMPVIMPYEDGSCYASYLYPDGTVKATGECDGDKKAGYWTIFFKNGEKLGEGKIENGFLDGPWIFYYPNGQKRLEGSFTPGKFELGCAGSQIYTSSSVKTGRWQLYNSEGQLLEESHFLPAATGEEYMSGIYTRWYPDGTVSQKGKFKYSSKVGKWMYYYENGKKMREENYIYKDCRTLNGGDYVDYECASGTWIEWNQDGTVLSKITYKNGLKIK
ncbi:MAG: hypothetical protein JXR91_15860, partial [Deltaproteobacteria bacterium]|nr:hypothetical protein [Deltaproteobacteria bacterium]